MKNEKKYNKALFKVEAVIGIAATVAFLVTFLIGASMAETQLMMGICIMVVSFLSFVIICLALTRMEQIVGYYVCEDCHHKHVPNYNAVLWSMHLGRTRYMQCPKCHKKTWQRKVA